MRKFGFPGVFLFLCLWGHAQPAPAADVEAALARLSWEEKIGQMILVYHSPGEFLRQYHVGGVLIMAGMLKHPGKLAADIARTQAGLGIKLFVAIDQEGGKVNRLSSLEAWRKVPSAFDLRELPPDSIVSHNRRVARALKGLGVNLNLAPVLDPSHDWQGRTTFIAMEGRSFGKTAEEILGPANAYMDGFTQEGIACLSKHFPGYDVQENSDHHIAVSDADSAAIAGYREPFSRLASKVVGIMISSIHYRKVSPRPSVFSPEIVGMARDLAPDAVLMTDDLWGTALRAYVSGSRTVHPVQYPDAEFRKLVEAAFWAGNDMFMITFPAKVPLLQSALLALARDSAPARARIDASAARILRAKAKLGLAPGLPPRGKAPAAFSPGK